MRTPAIVVGTDSAQAGAAAVRWAAREAERRHLPLRVVHVLDWDWSVNRYDYQGDRFEVARRLAAAAAAEAAGLAGETATGVEVGFEVPVGHPVSHLVRMSATAALVVVGSRGRGGFTGLLLGSVSQRVAAHARCPVAVVRGRTGAPRDPVVAGVDDSPVTDAVLEAAFTAARDRGAGLIAVRAYTPALALPLGRIPVGDIEVPDQEAAERERLTARLAPWQAKFPEVRVDMLLARGSAAAVLVEVSHGTQLVVVGGHGHGLFSGIALGSTGQQLLHHADCPVLVVHGDAVRKS